MSIIKQDFESVFRSQSQNAHACTNCIDVLKSFYQQNKDGHKTCQIHKILLEICSFSQERFTWLYNILCKNNSYEICQKHYYPYKYYQTNKKEALCEECYNVTIREKIRKLGEEINNNQQQQQLNELKKKVLQLDCVKELNKESIDQDYQPNIDKEQIEQIRNKMMKKCSETIEVNDMDPQNVKKDIDTYLKNRDKLKLAELVKTKLLHQFLHEANVIAHVQ